ncbi:MAG: YqgE/AlgH family protein [Myxococcota bacterium]|nr:YqgE/AlgH family protein [Myxococcota bacterium]
MSENCLDSSLLVAMPQLQDPNFNRSVVLLVQHGAEGSFGVILNRPAELLASDLCSSLDVEWQGNPEMAVHWGGPVQPETGWMLFSSDGPLEFDPEEATSLANGLYFAGSLGVLEAVAQAPPSSVRLFLGYSGWGAGQLEGELAAGSWLVVPGTSDVVDGVPPEAMWEHVVRGLGVEPAALVSTQGVH